MSYMYFLQKIAQIVKNLFIGIFAQNRPEVLTVTHWATKAQRILDIRVS